MKDAAGSLEIAPQGDRELVMKREFDAPRTLVFEAFTRPDLLKRWLLGPDGWTLAVCEIDLRVGGKYRYVWHRATDDVSMGMGGVYREVVAPERIVATERFDQAWYPGEAVATMTFTERRGRTVFTQTMEYESRAARDAVLESGMEEGVRASYDRLAQVLASL